MKKLLFTLLAAGILSIPLSYFQAEAIQPEEPSVVAVDEYDFSLRLRVPQVIDNMESQGYRKFKNQNIKGRMLVNWLEDNTFFLEFNNLDNRNFKVRGRNVKYKGYENKDLIPSRFNWIGNNKTGIFKTPCICFYLELEPSYAIGGNNEDNSLFLLLSGKGTSTLNKLSDTRLATSFSGYATGTQGCGCMAYGHKSPTRKGMDYGPTDEPEDVVATFGTWVAKWRRRIQ